MTTLTTTILSAPAALNGQREIQYGGKTAKKPGASETIITYYCDNRANWFYGKNVKNGAPGGGCPCFKPTSSAIDEINFVF